MRLDIQRENSTAKLPDRLRGATDLVPRHSHFAAGYIREFIQRLNTDDTSPLKEALGGIRARIGAERVNQYVAVQHFGYCADHRELASSRSNFHPAGSGLRIDRIRSSAFSRVRSRSTSKARSPATRISISSPSLRPSASTTAAGSRIARLLPHREICMTAPFKIYGINVYLFRRSVKEPPAVLALSG